MLLDIAYYETTAQIIPVFLLALLVQEVMVAPGLRDEARAITNNRSLAYFTASGLLAEALCLYALATQSDNIFVAVLTIIGTGGVVAVMVSSHFARLAFASNRLARWLGFAPLLAALLIASVATVDYCLDRF